MKTPWQEFGVVARSKWWAPGETYVNWWPKQKVWPGRRSYELCSSKNEVKTWTGFFYTLTSAIPMRYSSVWAIRPTRSRSSCEFMITPRGCMDISVESMKIMFGRCNEVQLVKHCIGVAEVRVQVAFGAEFFRPSFGCCLRRAHNCDDHVKVCLLDFF